MVSLKTGGVMDETGGGFFALHPIMIKEEKIDTKEKNEIFRFIFLLTLFFLCVSKHIVLNFSWENKIVL